MRVNASEQLQHEVASLLGKGAVRNFTSYGAFVELEEGIDGMIHVSDMSWTRKVNHQSEVLEKGAEVNAVVLEVDSGNQRISLGLKQATDDPWPAATAKARDRLAPVPGWPAPLRLIQSDAQGKGY